MPLLAMQDSALSPIAPGVRGTIPAYGSNCQFDLFGIIPVTHSLNTQAALDRAKESADVDVLTDVTVDFGASYYVLFSNNCVRVRLLQWLRLQSARCPEERRALLLGANLAPSCALGCGISAPSSAFKRLRKVIVRWAKFGVAFYNLL